MIVLRPQSLQKNKNQRTSSEAHIPTFSLNPKPWESTLRHTQHHKSIFGPHEGHMKGPKGLAPGRRHPSIPSWTAWLRAPPPSSKARRPGVRRAPTALRCLRLYHDVRVCIYIYTCISALICVYAYTYIYIYMCI